MLSITADHALRAVLMLARIPADHAMRADSIAEAIGAPRNYLAKTLNALAKAGIVRSSRGPFGGFSLAVTPHELTVARVTQLFDERPRTSHCLLSKTGCDPQNPCSAHARWMEITAASLSAIENTTIADLIGDSIHAHADVAPSHMRPWADGRRRSHSRSIEPMAALRAS